MKINFKNLIVSILIPVLLGSLVGLITASSNNYTNLNQPFFAPPAILFPIVWTILYILMGVSIYLIKESHSIYQRKAIFTYQLQLGVNLLWSIIFFLLKMRTFAFVWIILLIILVISMIKQFLKISKSAAYIQIPYLLWLIFASILNLTIIFLN